MPGKRFEVVTMDNQDMFFDAHAALQRQKLAQQAQEQAQQAQQQNELLGELVQEQTRKKSLPKCPECKTPMEIGATICTGCKERMVWCKLSVETRLGNVRTVQQWLPALFESNRSQLEAARSQIRNDLKSTVNSLVEAEQASRKLLELREENRGTFEALDTVLLGRGRDTKSDCFEKGLPMFLNPGIEGDALVVSAVCCLALGVPGAFFFVVGYAEYVRGYPTEVGLAVVIAFFGFAFIGGAVWFLAKMVAILKVRLKVQRCGAKLMSLGIATILKPVSAGWRRFQTVDVVVSAAMIAANDMTVIRAVAAENSIQLPAHSETETRYASGRSAPSWENDLYLSDCWPGQIRNCLHTLQALEPELEERTAYYIKRGTTLKGLFSVEKLLLLIKKKKLNRSDEVSQSPDGPWERLGDVYKSILKRESE